MLFELEVVAKWEGTLLDDDGRKVGAGDGELVVSQLDQDTGPDGSVRLAPVRACARPPRAARAPLPEPPVPLAVHRGRARERRRLRR